MALDLILTGTGVTAETNPMASISEYSIVGGNAGTVVLQYRTASSAKWITISSAKRGAIATPHLTHAYRFKYKGAAGVEVTFGP